MVVGTMVMIIIIIAALFVTKLLVLFNLESMQTKDATDSQYDAA